MRIMKYMLAAALLAVILPACFLVKKKPQKAPATALSARPGMARPADSLKKTTPKRFREVITKNHQADSGFLNVYRFEEKYFLEIPDSILNRDILVVSRVSKAPDVVRSNRGSDVYAGTQIGERVIRFTKSPRHKIFAQIVSYRERSADTSANGIYRSLERSTLQPIAAAFDIKATGEKGGSSVIDVSEFLLADQNILGFSATLKQSAGLGVLQKDKSYVEDIQAFTTNVELQTVNTYMKGQSTITFELNNSMVLLPLAPMKPRLADKRVGYFEETFADFDEPQGVATRRMITRFRLEPKPEDVQRYLAGELVEPAKQIVFYIDPTTPKKWVKYLIQGINDWQKAFEKAGFKNAVIGLEAPTDRKDWSLYDARHNAVVYMPSSMANAMGPHVHDPRSGEILETHIHWYHNVMSLLHDWYMVQAGPNDPRARKMVYDDELMGQLIRFVSSHEVGHTLGLRHNFIASHSVPVDSLRSASYLEKNGFCPSIMDYARFNYVAQPQDKIPPHLLMPRIGAYDEWAIEWGYRWYPEGETPEQEALRLSKLTTERLVKDNRLRFAGDFWGSPSDARTQTEDLGNNPMKANTYGIENLKRVKAGLRTWTQTPGGDYRNLTRMQQAVTGQYARYMLHVANYLTLSTTTARAEDEPGNVMGYIPRSSRKEAMAFLNKQLFETPVWMDDSFSARMTGYDGRFDAARVQDAVLTNLLSITTFYDLRRSSQRAPAGQAYVFGDMLQDLNNTVWKELKTGARISPERRVLQRIYAEKVIQMQNIAPQHQLNRQDAIPMVREHMRQLAASIDKAKGSARDTDTRAHLTDLSSKLRWALNPQSYIPPAPTPAFPGMTPARPSAHAHPGSCWHDAAYEQWFNQQIADIK